MTLAGVVLALARGAPRDVVLRRAALALEKRPQAEAEPEPPREPWNASARVPRDFRGARCCNAATQRRCLCSACWRAREIMERAAPSPLRALAPNSNWASLRARAETSPQGR